MIKANELRIGNWARVANLTGRVIDLHSNPDEIYFEFSPEYDYSPEMVNPIPITPEWLAKLGFNGNMWKEYESASVYHMFLREGQSGYDVWFHEHLLCKVAHVHQLQNLFFALTQIELTYTP